MSQHTPGTPYYQAGVVAVQLGVGVLSLPYAWTAEDVAQTKFLVLHAAA